MDHPEEIVRINAYLRENRHSLIKTLTHHADEVDALYREVIGASVREGASRF
jgi:hypothetical protein